MPESITGEADACLIALSGLYRGTFVYRLQARFRLMLAGFYSVYVTAVEEGFDPALRAHLVDVLNDILARTAELTDVFGQSLQESFDELSHQLIDKGSVHSVSSLLAELRAKHPGRAGWDLDEDLTIRQYIAESIEASEELHAGTLSAANKDYLRLLGSELIGCVPPLSPAGLYAAFAEVLREVALPIHSRIRLVMYRTFTQEVVPHLHEACQTFRDELPSDFERLGKARGWDSHLPGINVASELPWAVSYSNSEAPGAAIQGESLAVRSSAKRKLGSIGSESRAGFARLSVGAAPASRLSLSTLGPVFRWPGILLIAAGFALGSWQLGSFFAESGRLPSLVQKIEAKWPLDLTYVPGRHLPRLDGAADHNSTVSKEIKREVLSLTKLANMSWKAGLGARNLVFDLQITNESDLRVSSIELVCIQYSDTLEPLDVGKLLLSEEVEAHTAKSISDLPMELGVGEVRNVHCVIPDLSVYAAK